MGTPDVDQWLLFIPWKEIKELIFELGELTVHAPKHKYLILEGEFKDQCLANTSNLAALSVAMSEVSAKHFERSSSCNLNKFLGGVPRFQKLIGHIYFTEADREGYIAIIMPKPADWLKTKASFLSVDEYKKLRNYKKV